jgi:hypothetical protein
VHELVAPSEALLPDVCALAYARGVAVLASFVRFLVDFTAGSGDLGPAQEAQFSERRTLADPPIVGYYSQHIFEMKNQAGAFTTRERGMFGLHWLNTTGGEPDVSWVAADYAAVETGVAALWSTTPTYIGTDIRLVEHRWYAYGPGVVAPNPPSRITVIGSPPVGTNSSNGPHQLASTVTLRTTLRRHWGRIYLPVASSLFGAGGQMTQTNCDNLVNSARANLIGTPSAQGVLPVVWDRNRKLVFGVTQLEVDSVPDIVRRRRPRDTAFRSIVSS